VDDAWSQESRFPGGEVSIMCHVLQECQNVFEKLSLSPLEWFKDKTRFIHQHSLHTNGNVVFAGLVHVKD
jgi:hypothetical protein